MAKTKTIQRFATITLADGSKKRISARGATEREALQKLAKLKAEYETGIRAVNSNTTFSAWYMQWIEVYKKPAVHEARLKIISSVFKKFYLPQLGAMKIGEIKKIHVQNIINDFQGYSKNYMKASASVLKECFKEAKNNELITANPCDNLKLPLAEPREQRRALTEKERDLFLQVIKKSPYGAYFGIMYACGLRPNEARALTWEDIDFKNKRVNVNKAVESKTKNIKEPKTKAGIRTIPIPDWYLQMLNKIPRPINKDSLVFCNKPNSIISEYSTFTYWKRILKEMDIANGAETYKEKIIEKTIDYNITPYYLRHTFATMLGENNIPIKIAQKWMGHETPEMTLKFYQHASEKMEREAEEKFRQIYNAI